MTIETRILNLGGDDHPRSDNVARWYVYSSVCLSVGLSKQ